MPIELPSTPTNLGTLPNQINSFSGVSVLAEVAGGGGGGGGGPVDGLHTEAAEQLITEAGDYLIWEA